MCQTLCATTSSAHFFWAVRLCTLRASVKVKGLTGSRTLTCAMEPFELNCGAHQTRATAHDAAGHKSQQGRAIGRAKAKTTARDPVVACHWE